MLTSLIAVNVSSSVEKDEMGMDSLKNLQGERWPKKCNI